MGFEPQIRKIVDQIRVCFVLVKLNNMHACFLEKKYIISPFPPVAGPTDSHVERYMAQRGEAAG